MMIKMHILWFLGACISLLKVLTTRNSFLSTLSLPSVSNMLNAILNPDWGSTIVNQVNLNTQAINNPYLSVSKEERDTPCTR